MNLSSTIVREIKGLDEVQLKSLYAIIKSMKKKRSKKKAPGISLEEIWEITDKSKGNWSETVEMMREERG